MEEKDTKVLISFREWLHSYYRCVAYTGRTVLSSSHLFQRVASFLLSLLKIPWKRKTRRFSSLSESGFIPTQPVEDTMEEKDTKVLISFREWLHSYPDVVVNFNVRLVGVLISFREWLHSYLLMNSLDRKWYPKCSHLFQRVASFLHG